MTVTFKNGNGREYNIIDKCPFVGQDIEYYKNSWQQCRYALLEDRATGEVVIASMVGNKCWGNGLYYSKEEQGNLNIARGIYEEMKNDYLQTMGVN